jgi:hypothetical protein
MRKAHLIAAAAIAAGLFTGAVATSPASASASGQDRCARLVVSSVFGGRWVDWVQGSNAGCTDFTGHSHVYTTSGTSYSYNSPNTYPMSSTPVIHFNGNVINNTLFHDDAWELVSSGVYTNQGTVALNVYGAAH